MLLWWCSPSFKTTAHLQGAPDVGKSSRNRGGQGEHVAEKFSFCFAHLGSTKNAVKLELVCRSLQER